MTLLLLTVALLAQPSPAGCRTLEHRGFDFWIDSWEVRTTDGRVPGANLVTSELGGRPSNAGPACAASAA
jgi:hypothetical protein